MSGTGDVLKLNFQEPGAAKSCQLSANRSCLETGISKKQELEGREELQEAGRARKT
jgi:hypothetical protein